MLVVLMIISVLLLIAIPNMTKNNEVAANKGCEATIKLLQTQVHAYEIEQGEVLQDLSLLEGSYVESIDCPDGTTLEINNGVITRPINRFMTKTASGFTLIEVLVSLSILSILLLLPIMTLPNLTSTSHQADLAAKQLKEDLAFSATSSNVIRSSNFCSDK